MHRPYWLICGLSLAACAGDGAARGDLVVAHDQQVTLSSQERAKRRGRARGKDYQRYPNRFFAD